MRQAPLQPKQARPEGFEDYLDAAMADAVYEELADGSIAGEIPSCIGVVAYSTSREGCEKELRSVLEGWVLLGLELGHRLPRLRGIDLGRSAIAEVVPAS